MSRKVFLSFLGTNDYVPCYYYDEASKGKQSSLSKYVQTALIELYASDFSGKDHFFFFLTKDAKAMNWADNGQHNRETKEYDKQNIGLENRIKEIGIEPSFYTSKDIPEGFSSREIWDIFEIVRGSIEKGDEVYLDITHAFRSIPMLGMALLNYLKIIKKISVKGVFYGAFEKLGRAQEVLKMKEEDRLAPIINLQTFSELQDWTIATNSFVRYGKTDQLEEIAKTPLSQLASDFKGTEENFNALRKVFASLNQFSSFIETNRGIELKDFPFEKLKAQMDEVNKSQELYLPAYQANLETLRERIEIFSEKNPLNFINIVKWSRENGMLQQAITQLKEGITSYFAQKHNKSYSNEDIRDNIDRALYSLKDEKLSSKNYLFENPLEEDEEAQGLAEGFRNFSVNVRNDINHNGMREGASQPKKLKEQFDRFLSQVEDILNFKASQKQENSIPCSLLNLSNHPSALWPENQKNTAIKNYGNIQDLPFPQINPEWDSDKIDQLAEKYKNKIKELNPTAVHLMGEMTFIFNLINRLKSIGISCIASTTERIATEDEKGNKTSSFQFIRFRNY